MSNNTWEVVETRVSRRVMAQVSARKGDHDSVPLYSIKIGTAQLLDDGNTRISSHMSIYDAADAATLLQEMATKYVDARSKLRAESAQGSTARRYRQAP